jgi:hypothetical protein
MGHLTQLKSIVKPVLEKVKGARGHTISDSLLLAELEEASLPTCRPRMKFERPMRVLKQSLLSTYRNGRLRNWLSYSQVARRVRLHYPTRLGIAKARQMTDRCPVCHCWDHKVQGKHKTEVAEVLNSLKAEDTDYWCGCTILLEPQLDKPSYYMDIINYIHNRRGSSSASSSEPPSLPIHEATAVLKLTELHDETVAYAGHWSLRDIIYEYIQSSKENPLPNTLYIWMDFQEQHTTCTCSLMPQSRGGRSVTYAPQCCRNTCICSLFCRHSEISM